MSTLAIISIVVVVYVIAVVITFALMKTASNADDAIESWRNEDKEDH